MESSIWNLWKRMGRWSEAGVTLGVTLEGLFRAGIGCTLVPVSSRQHHHTGTTSEALPDLLPHKELKIFYRGAERRTLSTLVSTLPQNTPADAAND